MRGKGELRKACQWKQSANVSDKRQANCCKHLPCTHAAGTALFFASHGDVTLTQNPSGNHLFFCQNMFKEIQVEGFPAYVYSSHTIIKFINVLQVNRFQSTPEWFPSWIRNAIHCFPPKSFIFKNIY